MEIFDRDGTALAYRELGTGPLAVFVHGFPLDSTMWLEQLELLRGVRRCVAIDLRGFGASDAVAEPVLAMEQHAEDVAALADHLGADRIDLVGLSMGGYVALAFAELFPQRLRTLALVDTRAAADSETVKAGRDMMAVRVTVQGRGQLAVEMAEALLGPAASLHVKARMRTMVEGTRVETVVAALEGMKQRPARFDVLSRLSIPVGVVVGEDDTATPVSEAEQMVDAAPDASLTIVEAAGHMTPMENPTAVADALERIWARAGHEGSVVDG